MISTESAPLKTTKNIDAPQTIPTSQNVAPQNPTVQAKKTIKVIKRNGQVVPFDLSKISIALTKAFLQVEGGTAAASNRIHELTASLTTHVHEVLIQKYGENNALHIENVQDQVVVSLMRAGQYEVATQYILYRDQRRKERQETEAPKTTNELRIKMADGELKALDQKWLDKTVQEACAGITDVNTEQVITETKRNLFDGISQKDLSRALILAARILVEREPNYRFVTARLLLNDLRAEAFEFLSIQAKTHQTDAATAYPKAFEAFIQKGIDCSRLSTRLQSTFDLTRLGVALKPERDLQFNYLSIQTLYDRYLIHEGGVRYELPQVFFMRVAMGLALEEDKPNDRAIEFYELLSSFNYMSSTPTLFNSGTIRSQLSSCYLSTVGDDLDQIYGSIRDNALLQKFAGGLGNDWTPVRAMHAHIKGTNGESQGIIPFLKVVNDTAVAVNQGGKRKGAVCAYLETWHLDIEEFLDLRKNSGDDRRRTHDMNTANWIPDLFMQRVMDKAGWTLFTPNEVPDLHELYGEAFNKRYAEYEKLAAEGKLLHKKIPAITLWRKMLTMLFETGHPWVTFKDPCNIRSPQQHCGVVHSSNLCTEITLNTSEDEVAVCNLGSINIPAHLTKLGEIDHTKLEKTIQTAVRMLDNVVDINYYAIPQARRSNLRHRPIGLGIMGFQDALYIKRLPYDSDEAVQFADDLMEAISFYAIEASSKLAEERGSYETFEGSLWSQGILPIDSVKMLKQQRGQHFDQDNTKKFNWKPLKNRVRTKGIRNSNIMAIAPTATISNIVGVSQSIEPTYQNLYVKSNLSGEFTVSNPYLVQDLKDRDLWDEVMVNDLKYYDGSVQNISRVPAELKALYKTAFEIDPQWLIQAASRRQKWIDQAQSLNLYMAEPSGKKLDELYKFAWIKGLKTTYYLRSMGATSAEKSTGNGGELNAVSAQPAAMPKACSILDPDCEACQ